MIDPRREAVLIADRGTGTFSDETWKVAAHRTRPGGGTVDVIIPSDEVPEDLRKAIMAERDRFFEILTRMFCPTTQPAATQPAATQPATR